MAIRRVRLDDQTLEQALVERNFKLVKSDDSEVVCHVHNITKRWGDLDPITQLAVLNGWDIEGDKCIMDEMRNKRSGV